MPQAFVQFVRESIGSKKVAGLLLVVILCTNLTLCLFRLDHQSFNRDEGFSVYMGQVPIASFLRIVWDRELNMVAYYALLRGWSRISDSEIFVRLLSVSFAVGTVALIAALGGKLFDKRTGLLAAFLLAIHASAVVYAQNARAYTMAAFLVTLSWLLLIRLLERWSWWLLTA